MLPVLYVLTMSVTVIMPPPLSRDSVRPVKGRVCYNGRT